MQKCIAACNGAVGRVASTHEYNVEDNINILLTKDPAKRKIRLQGFDGHSYRCYHFWPENFPDINPECPDSINSLKEHALRGKAKAPHFLLQYLGTWNGLVTNAGFEPEEAKKTEKRYLTMFKQSYDWLDEQIDKISKQGYAELAFGLRIRAPVLHRTIIGSTYTPKAAAQERRSVGNAVSGQSYGLLNSRLGFKLQEEVLESDYKHDIKPSAQIHDANYLLVRDSAVRIAWLNSTMRRLAQWQELPELKDPDIILDGELDLFYPSWANGITIKPMNATPEELREITNKAMLKYKS